MTHGLLYPGHFPHSDQNEFIHDLGTKTFGGYPFGSVARLYISSKSVQILFTCSVACVSMLRMIWPGH